MFRTAPAYYSGPDNDDQIKTTFFLLGLFIKSLDELYNVIKLTTILIKRISF